MINGAGTAASGSPPLFVADCAVDRVFRVGLFAVAVEPVASPEFAPAEAFRFLGASLAFRAQLVSSNEHTSITANMDDRFAVTVAPSTILLRQAACHTEIPENQLLAKDCPARSGKNIHGRNTKETAGAPLRPPRLSYHAKLLARLLGILNLGILNRRRCAGINVWVRGC